MCMYIEKNQLKPEIYRMLIEEFGSVKNAKNDFVISNFHLPEHLQLRLPSMLKAEFPQLTLPYVDWKQCFIEINAMTREILAEL